MSQRWAAPRRYWRDLIGLVAHHLLWFGLPLLCGASFAWTLLVYLLVSSLKGYWLALVFWVNHVGMGTLASDEPVSYLHRQLATTRNVTSRVLGDWFFGGLNYQIEHHLFPGCPRRHLASAQALIRPFCREHGLPYHEQAYFDALRTITGHVLAIGRLEPAGTARADEVRDDEVADLPARGAR